jgi:hypothetical protein
MFFMGFWDDKVDNPIDSMFDFDRDGELNSTEKAMEFDFLSGGNSSNISMSDDDLYQDLSFTGITKDEFELMDDDEKREALEDAGIDVDDYDDFDSDDFSSDDFCSDDFGSDDFDF